MKIGAINFSSIRFNAKNKKQDAPVGVNYNSLKQYETHNFSHGQILNAAHNGVLTCDMSDELILNRLEKTIKHANSFAKEHPKFDKEEVAQDLIEVMIRAARDYKGEEGGNFNRYAFAKETEYLISLLK